MSSSVIVLEFNELVPDLLDRFMASGHLPNFKRLRDQSVAYSQAAFRWVLENPAVSCLVVSFFKPEQCDEYLFASGGRLARSDREILRRYEAWEQARG